MVYAINLCLCIKLKTPLITIDISRPGEKKMEDLDQTLLYLWTYSTIDNYLHRDIKQTPGTPIQYAALGNDNLVQQQTFHFQIKLYLK